MDNFQASEGQELIETRRGPVQAIELEIDPQTGMKNYIANERGGWMTSSSYVRNSLLRCIELGRNYKQNGGDVMKFESLRVLGQALHTLEGVLTRSCVSVR